MTKNWREGPSQERGVCSLYLGHFERLEFCELMTSRDADLETASEHEPPLVSVVIPCHNGARFVGPAIESVLAQSHPRIEVIVIDDGSIDDTANIARSYPVIYRYQQQSGTSAARNHGLAQSRGKYIQFLDHDDRLLPEAIETGVRLLETNPDAAIAVGEHRYIDAQGTVLGASNKRAAGRDHYAMLLEHNFIETPCSAFHRRSSFLKTGNYADGVQGAEDYELYLRMARNFPLIAHEGLVAEYRLHSTNTSRNSEVMMQVSHRVLAMELAYVRGNGAREHCHRNGVRFVDRHFGRLLTRELVRDGQLPAEERRRKLGLLRRHYAPGFVAVWVCSFLPHRLVSAFTGTS
jgi:glycosyltransferase involved in cell wall biosynthesis